MRSRTRRRWASRAVLAGLCAVPLGACNESSSSGDTSGGTTGGSGSAAQDYLTSNDFTSLDVEVDYVQGQDPDPSSLSLLETRLQERCDKPGGVVVATDEQIPPSGQSSWSLDEIRDLEDDHRDGPSSGSTAVLYVLYVDGDYEGDGGNEQTLGISYSASSFVIFKETLDGLPGPPTTEVEEAVLVHEAGHNLGLVDNGIPMVTPHEDGQNPKHDVDDDCVMHHTISTSVVAQITGTIPDQFDPLCIDDVQAAGGQ